MKAVIDISAWALAIWIAIGKIFIPLFIPPILQNTPVEELAVDTSAASTQIENMRCQVEGLKSELSDCATASSVNSNYAALNKKVEELDKYVKLLPTECPPPLPPKIPQEIYDRLNVLEQKLKNSDVIPRPVVEEKKRSAATPKNNVQKVVEEARLSNKHVLFYYDQDNCPYCRRFEKDVLNTDYVHNSLKDDVIFYNINKDHIGPGEDFAIPPAVPAVQLAYPFPEGGIKNTTIEVPIGVRTPEMFVSVVRSKFERRM